MKKQNKNIIELHYCWHESEGNTKIKLKKQNKNTSFIFLNCKKWVGRVGKTKNKKTSGLTYRWKNVEIAHPIFWSHQDCVCQPATDKTLGENEHKCKEDNLLSFLCSFITAHSNIGYTCIYFGSLRDIHTIFSL